MIIIIIIIIIIIFIYYIMYKVWKYETQLFFKSGVCGFVVVTKYRYKQIIQHWRLTENWVTV